MFFLCFSPGLGEIRIGGNPNPLITLNSMDIKKSRVEALSFRMFQGLGFRAGEFRLRVEALALAEHCE